MRSSGVPVFDAAGAFKGYRGVGSDVTREKEAEEALRASEEEAVLANRAKTEFLANMSHELRTPLNAIIGFSAMMEHEAFGPVANARYREYVRDIRESGQHLLGLINDILDISKIESGRFELHEELVDVEEAMRAAVRLVGGRSEEAGHEVAQRFPPDLPRLRADERALKQILLNLLSNAVKFTREGGRITVAAAVEDDHRLVVSVADTGIGIAAQDLPRVMEPFRQLESALARKCDGTGLGLPLTKRLVELHQGELRLESEVGVGTTASIRFPAERIVPLRDAAD
jgi:signal transduction histidine kinase